MRIIQTHKYMLPLLGAFIVVACVSVTCGYIKGLQATNAALREQLSKPVDRNIMCVNWWFNDTSVRLVDAKRHICKKS